LLPDITSEIILEGNGPTLDGNNSFRVLNVQPTGNLTLNNATITGGYTSERGGGIFNQGTLTVNNSTLSSNVAKLGGGIYHLGTLALNNSTVSANSVSINGGGIANNPGVPQNVILKNSTLSGSEAGEQGGGIFHVSHTVVVNNSTISGNSASKRGGIGTSYIVSVVVNLNRSLISGKLAPIGAEVNNSTAGTVIANNYNVVGYDGDVRSSGFTPGLNDIIPPGQLATVLDVLALSPLHGWFRANKWHTMRLHRKQIRSRLPFSF
jgi:hypothetical protein